MPAPSQTAGFVGKMVRKFNNNFLLRRSTVAFKSLLESGATARYVNQTIFRDSDLKRRLREETAKIPDGGMQISPDQGAFLGLLAKAIGTKRALEVGTFTGYSALCVAEVLPTDGKLVACDVSEEWTSMGRRYWKEAGLEGRIDLRLAPALETLAKLIAAGEVFDFAFVDANKDDYDGYYEACLKLLRPGGVLVMDNVLGNIPHGVKAADYDPATSRFHQLNLKIKNDPRVTPMIATVGAGLMLAFKN